MYLRDLKIKAASLGNKTVLRNFNALGRSMGQTNRYVDEAAVQQVLRGGSGVRFNMNTTYTTPDDTNAWRLPVPDPIPAEFTHKNADFAKDNIAFKTFVEGVQSKLSQIYNKVKKDQFWKPYHRDSAFMVGKKPSQPFHDQPLQFTLPHEELCVIGKGSGKDLVHYVTIGIEKPDALGNGFAILRPIDGKQEDLSVAATTTRSSVELDPKGKNLHTYTVYEAEKLPTYVKIRRWASTYIDASLLQEAYKYMWYCFGQTSTEKTVNWATQQTQTTVKDRTFDEIKTYINDTIDPITKLLENLIPDHQYQQLRKAALTTFTQSLIDEQRTCGEKLRACEAEKHKSVEGKLDCDAALTEVRRELQVKERENTTIKGNQKEQQSRLATLEREAESRKTSRNTCVLL